jgi:hypothetical protein
MDEIKASWKVIVPPNKRPTKKARNTRNQVFSKNLVSKKVGF